MTLIEHIRWNVWWKNRARLKSSEDADSDINIMSNAELLEHLSKALEDVLEERGVKTDND